MTYEVFVSRKCIKIRLYIYRKKVNFFCHFHIFLLQRNISAELMELTDKSGEAGCEEEKNVGIMQETRP